MKHLKYFIFFLISLMPFQATPSSEKSPFDNRGTIPAKNIEDYVSDDSDDDVAKLKFKLGKARLETSVAQERAKLLQTGLTNDTQHLHTEVKQLRKSLKEQAATNERLKTLLEKLSATNAELKAALQSVAITAAEILNKPEEIDSVTALIMRQENTQILANQIIESLLLLDETMQIQRHCEENSIRKFIALSMHINETRWCLSPSSENIINAMNIQHPRKILPVPTFTILAERGKRVSFLSYASPGSILRRGQSGYPLSLYPIAYGCRPPVDGLGRITRLNPATDSAAGASPTLLQ